MKKIISVAARFPISVIQDEKVKKPNTKSNKGKTFWERILKKLKVIKQ